jgi:6-pyruvoyltetrahydropterin/6-carboxytetrahydropterin synthase
MDRPIKLHTEVVIDSAHFLKNYEGNCANIHGHSWRCRIWIKGSSWQLNDLGILFDFTNVKKIKDRYDHKLLNECSPFNSGPFPNPTAENIALVIYNSLKSEEFVSGLEFVVRVYETSVGKETWAQTGDWDEGG